MLRADIRLQKLLALSTSNPSTFDLLKCFAEKLNFLIVLAGFEAPQNSIKSKFSMAYQDS
jgi:hypothetical protein